MRRLVASALERAAAILAIAVCAFGPVAAHAGTRVQAANLNYLGVASIPAPTGSCSTGQNAFGSGMAHDPAGNGGAGSLYIVGQRDRECIAEISIPNVGGTATLLQGWTDNTIGGARNSVDNDCSTGCYLGGLYVNGSELLVNVFGTYDNWPVLSGGGSLFRRSKTLATANPTGPFAIDAADPIPGEYRSSYMARVPAAFQGAPYNFGPAVVGGCCYSIQTTNSFGPDLWTLDPADLTTSNPLVYYDINFPERQTLGEWASQDFQPEINETTSIHAVTFIEGTDSVLFIGTSGAGAYCYGSGCADAACECTAGNCTQGGHAPPYHYYVWAYDVDDLAAARNGSVSPWSVLPYAFFELPASATHSISWCGDDISINGAWYNPATSRLYLYRHRNLLGTALTPTLAVYEITGLGGSGADAAGAASGAAAAAGHAKIRLPAPGSLNRVAK